MRQLRLKKGIQNRNRIGNAAQLDEQVLGSLGPPQQPEAGPDQVVADGAADAAVGEVDRVALNPDDEFGVDIDRTEVVDENRDAHAVVAAQDVIEQCRFAGSEKPGNQGHGDTETDFASGHCGMLQLSSALNVWVRGTRRFHRLR